MIRESKFLQYGLPNFEPKGIVIHNTSNYDMSARELEKWLDEENRSSNGCHYLVDHNEVIQVMPLTWSVYSSGMGYDYCNLHCIAIEICSNSNDELYLQGQDKAIELINQLMDEYGFTQGNIFFHRDFNPKINCPATILRMYGDRNNFVNKFWEIPTIESNESIEQENV